MQEQVRILIVDDDELDRMIYTENLSKSNTDYKVECVNTSQRGLEFCKKNPPDCILLDYNLPDLNGIQFLQHLYEDEEMRKIPALLFTGQGAEEVAVDALKSGAKDYIIKDNINTESLDKAIRNVLHNHALELQIKRQQDELHQMAYHDELTSLLNRFSFRQILEGNISTAKRNEEHLFVMFMDLDHFKLVNDTLGHQKGDLLLKQVANKILHCLRKGDVLGRFGGDEFVVGLTNFRDVKDVHIVAEKILATVSGQYELDGAVANIGTSIGISIFPKDGDSVDELIRCADQAMYSAKNSTRNTYCFYNETLQQEVGERVKIEGALREELNNERLFVHYQPQFNIDTGEIVCIESLLRCNHPEYGYLPPDKLISIAHEVGIMSDLGYMIVEQTLRDYKDLTIQQKHKPRIAINVSPKELRDPRYFEMFKKVIDKYQIPPQNIEIEITESFIVEHAEIIESLVNFRNLGVKLSIDDFGTGYSSLAQLKAIMPINAIKIDKTFVQSMTTNPYDSKVVKSIIDIANNFELEVIAEGVELSEHLSMLVDFGCKYIQGYYYSKPLPFKRVEKLIKKVNVRE